MKYSFIGKIFRDGNRNYIKIPFNVWETCGQKGMIPVKADIESVVFECKLVPKGHGNYYIPVLKAFSDKLGKTGELKVSFEIIEELSRINSRSPYTKKEPVRKINSIDLVLQPEAGLCGQACLAMLSGADIKEIIKIMKYGKWQASFSRVIETLNYFGIEHSEKMTYTQKKDIELSKCCILNIRDEKSLKNSHMAVYFEKKFYDPVHGISEKYNRAKIISFLEIKV